MITFSRECEGCGAHEERLFQDSWTGKELCIDCLLAIGSRLSLSPQTDGDNLDELLEEV